MAAGTAFEAIFPSGLGIGAGLGMAGIVGATAEKFASKGVEEFSERAVRWAVSALIGETLLEPPPEVGEGNRDAIATPDEALAAHVAIAQGSLSRLQERPYQRVHGLRIDAEDHLKRVVELSREHGGPEALTGAAELALEVLVQMRTETDWEPLIKIAFQAVSICVLARGQETGFRAAPSYTERPFSDTRRGYFDYEETKADRALSELRRMWPARTDSFSETPKAAAQRPSPGWTREQRDDDEGEARYTL